MQSDRMQSLTDFGAFAAEGLRDDPEVYCASRGPDMLQDLLVRLCAHLQNGALPCAGLKLMPHA